MYLEMSIVSLFMLINIFGNVHHFFVYGNQCTWKCALFLCLCKSTYLEMCIVSLFILINIHGSVQFLFYAYQCIGNVH